MSRLPALAALLLGPLAAAEAVAACAIDLTSVAFGTIDVARTEDGTGKVKVTCDQAQVFLVGIGSGAGGQGGRKMVGPGDSRLSYELYLDPGRNEVWGDGETTGQALIDASDGVKPGQYTIYGRVPAQPGKPPGSYADSLVVTVTF
jgi:spore coat protein U-like protein